MAEASCDLALDDESGLPYIRDHTPEMIQAEISGHWFDTEEARRILLSDERLLRDPPDGVQIFCTDTRPSNIVSTGPAFVQGAWLMQPAADDLPRNSPARIKLQSLSRPVVESPAPLSDPNDGVTVVKISHMTDKDRDPNFEARVYALICHPNNTAALPRQTPFLTKEPTGKTAEKTRFPFLLWTKPGLDKPRLLVQIKMTTTAVLSQSSSSTSAVQQHDATTAQPFPTPAIQQDAAADEDLIAAALGMATPAPTVGNHIPEQLRANISRYITDGSNKRARLCELASHMAELIGDDQDDLDAVVNSLRRGPLDTSVEMNVPHTAEQWESTLREFEARRVAGERFTAADLRLAHEMEKWFATNYTRLLFVYFALEGDPLREALSEEAATVRNALGSSLVDVDFVSDISISQLVHLLAAERESPYNLLHFSGHGHGDKGGAYNRCLLSFELTEIHTQRISQFLLQRCHCGPNSAALLPLHAQMAGIYHSCAPSNGGTCLASAREFARVLATYRHDTGALQGITTSSYSVRSFISANSNILALG